jgi:hypothetical protein
MRVQLRVVGIYYNKVLEINEGSFPNPTVKDVLDAASRHPDNDFFYIGTRFTNGASLDVIGHKFNGNRNRVLPCANVEQEIKDNMTFSRCSTPIAAPREREAGWYIIADALGEEPEKAWQYYILDNECRELSTKGKFVPFDCSNDVENGGVQIHDNYKIILRCVSILTKPSNLCKRYVQRLDQLLAHNSDPNIIVGPAMPQLFTCEDPAQTTD